MRVFVRMLAVSGMAVLAACGSDERAVDDALRADLSLAAQARPYMQPYVSPQEMGYGGTPYGYPAPYPQQAPYGYPPQYPQYQQYPQAPTPVVYQQPAPRIIRQAPAPVVVAAPSGGGGSAGGGSGEGRVVTNTKQDAILGATAGAILGAVTSRDRLKGAVIGAAAGGLLGGVIGSQVHTRRVP